MSLARPRHAGSDQQPPQGSRSHSGETPPGPCSLRAGVALTLELIRHRLFGLLCPLGQQGEQGCPGGSVEPPQGLWSRPHERSEVRGRPSGQCIHRFHGNAPPSLHPQGPVHLEVRRGARESRLCPGCWTGQPSHPQWPGWPAALCGRGPSWGQGVQTWEDGGRSFHPSCSCAGAFISAVGCPPLAPAAPLSAPDALLVARHPGRVQLFQS